MKNIFPLPKCPHCGGRLNYFQAFRLLLRRNAEEYVCPVCGKPLKVEPTPSLNYTAIATVGIVMALLFFCPVKYRIYGIAALGLIFLFVAPFLLCLNPPSE